MLHRLPAALIASLIILHSCAVAPAYAAEEGIASVYGAESGKRRADGRPFNPLAIGCAHKTLPLGSIHRVTNLANGRSILCPINDRGPYVADRKLDLSASGRLVRSASPASPVSGSNEQFGDVPGMPRPHDCR